MSFMAKVQDVRRRYLVTSGDGIFKVGDKVRYKAENKWGRLTGGIVKAVKSKFIVQVRWPSNMVGFEQVDDLELDI